MTDDAVARLNAALEGRYRIERTLGQGGMATVYLAQDLKHHRNVAVKVLREDLSATVGAARFLREIEIAAQLQHPNVLPLLDSGDAGGLLFYVMPYVEGQSLRDRLRRGGELPVGEAIRVLVEIVDALAYAHEHGVIHRDIKPGNVMLTGRHALITDFGVAKAVSEAAGGNTLTSMGVALGTPAYMAPEQAVADPHVDQRADIYALGVVGYELLTGVTPFEGATPQQVLAAHITEEPDPVTKHRPGIPEPLEAAVMRCLQKRPADRWQSAEDLLAALEPLATPSGGTAPATVTAARTSGVHPLAVVTTVGIAAALVVVAAAVWHLIHPPPATLVIGRSEQLTSALGLEIQPAISPDGKLVAYAAGNSVRMRIFLRPIGGGRTLAISDDSTAVEYQPRWSPDGTKLLFLSHGGVSVSPALGGTSTPVLAPSPATRVVAATWSADGTEIAFVRGDSLYRVSATGGTPRLIGTGRDWHSCSWSPKGAWIACVSRNGVAVQPGTLFGNLAPSAIVLIPLEGGAVDTVAAPTELNESPVWGRGGRRLYFLSNRDGPRDVYAVDISGSGTPQGRPVRLTTGLNAGSFSLSADGAHLAYDVYTSRSNIWSVPIPSRGNTTIADATQLTFANQVVESMRVSHDGRWLLYDSNLHGHSDIYRIPVGGGTPEQLTSEPWDEFAPDLSPDGTEVAYHSFRNGTRDIEVKPLNGGPVQLVTATPAQESFPSWSPDGRRLVFTDQEKSFPAFVATRGADGKWSVGSPIDSLVRPVWSPDGPWIAGVGAKVGSAGAANEINVYNASDGTLRHVYVAAAGEPRFMWLRWSPDGRTLYAKRHDEAGLTSFWVLPVAGGRPRLLVRFTDPDRQSARADFGTDGKRFYFTIEDRQSDVYVADVTRK